MITSIEDQSLSGKSDHSVFRLDFSCYTILQNYIMKEIYYKKVDYEAINTAIHEINLEKQLQDKPVGDQRTFFKKSIIGIITNHVPSKKIAMKLSKRSGLSCDAKTLEKI